MEYARNVLGIAEADHEEISPNAQVHLIHRLECVIAGQVRPVRFLAGTMTFRVYGKELSNEHFRCSFGLNPEYRQLIADGKLRVSGTDENGEARIVELSGHPFFVATLFLPQLSSTAAAPHPLFTEFLRVAARESRGTP